MKRKECTESCSKAIGPEDRGGGLLFGGFCIVFFFFIVGDCRSSSVFWKDKPSLWLACFWQQVSVTKCPVFTNDFLKQCENA